MTFSFGYQILNCFKFADDNTISAAENTIQGLISTL